MLKTLLTLPPPVLLITATTLEVSGDAPVPKGIYSAAGAVRAALIIAGGLIVTYGKPA